MKQEVSPSNVRRTGGRVKTKRSSGTGRPDGSTTPQRFGERITSSLFRLAR
jgi:hypothetical protein